MDGQTIAYIIAAIGCVIGIAGWLRNSNSDAGEQAALNAKYAAWEITEEGLGAHTVAELAEYMADWGIPATGCNLKADFVAAILAQRVQ